MVKYIDETGEQNKRTEQSGHKKPQLQRARPSVLGLINAGQICPAKCNNFLPTSAAAANSLDSFALHTHNQMETNPGKHK